MPISRCSPDGTFTGLRCPLLSRQHPSRLKSPSVLDQRLAFPDSQVLNFPTLGEDAPVYSGSFRGVGSLLLIHPLPEGNLKLSGLLTFQQCSDTVCEPPEALPFELTLTLEPFLISDREREQREQKGG